MEKVRKNRFSTYQIVVIAILAAIGSVLYKLEIVVFPAVPFYKLDLSNLPVLLGTFAMGPVVGSVTLLIKSAVGLFTSTSQGVGELADFLLGLAMVLPVGFLYRKKKSRGTAVLGMAVGGVAATVAGVLLNYFLLIPFFAALFGIQVDVIIAMGTKMIPAVDSLWKFVWFVTAPFNLIKWSVIALVTGLVYKPLSPILHGRKNRLIQTEKEQ
ncbi:MAG: ECF transporter S component [Clostridiales bacterium]|nr:ECF transporter S component [Clostridiales bacterium]